MKFLSVNIEVSKFLIAITIHGIVVLPCILLDVGFYVAFAGGAIAEVLRRIVTKIWMLRRPTYLKG
jgi:uncharacterized membrane protein SpoIIM required for sporulation